MIRVSMILAIAFLGCQTSANKDPIADTLKTETIVNTQIIRQNSTIEPTFKSKPPRSPGVTVLHDKMVRACQDEIGQKVVPYKKIFRQAHRFGANLKLSPSTKAFVKLNLRDCRSVDGQAQVRESIQAFEAELRPTVGFLQSGQSGVAAISELIAKGAQSRLKESPVPLVIRPSLGTKESNMTALAKLILEDRVSLILAGAGDPEIRFAGYWSKKLKLPVIGLSRHSYRTLDHDYAGNIFPRIDTMTQLLARTALGRGFKKIAVLTPHRTHEDMVVKSFQTEFEGMGGETPERFSYKSDNFESMAAAARELFQVSSVGREEEWRRLVRNSRNRSLAQGEAFNSRMVSLPPVMRYDAIFIPDDFRTVRHFIRIFQFLGVKKIPLIGHFGWRARGLLQGEEPFLDGAFFADFIGPYDRLPQSIYDPNGKERFFIEPMAAGKIDYLMTGYRAAVVAQSFLKAAPQKRSLLAHLRTPAASFFPTGLAFDKEGKGRWPAFLFEIRNGRLKVAGSMDQARRLPE